MPQAIEMLTLLRRIDQKLDTAAEFQAFATTRFKEFEQANRETRAFQAFATARFDQIDRRFDAMETRFDRKIDALRTELVDHMERLHQELDMRVREVEAAPRHTRARR